LRGVYVCVQGVEADLYGGREVWPLVEGGKGVAATNHASSGAWAAAGGIGTVSAVNADSYDAEGKIIPQIYNAMTRRERHEELIRYAIDGAVEQVRRAYDIASGPNGMRGAININVVGNGRCAAGAGRRAGKDARPCYRRDLRRGMPYKLSEIAARFNVNYLPIVSSARLRALWKRAYHKVSDLMAAVVYEDPWLAGGHNGLSNAENPTKPQDPIPALKRCAYDARRGRFDGVPIVMAGGVWFLREWNDWIDNPELGASPSSSARGRC
jgi:NAD(P)H-dependent flavin oxidoreductase YrpB (nitropropane dioxygenase family)